MEQISEKNAAFEPHCKMYERLPVPAVICDRELTVIWANACARGGYPSIVQANGLRRLLAEFEPQAVFEEMASNGSLTAAGMLPFSGMGLSLLPLEQGAVAMLLPIENRIGPEAPYYASKTAEAFSKGVRSSIGDIFSAMDTAAVKADLLQAGWLKEPFDRIGLAGYHVLRIAENIAAYTRFQSGTDILPQTIDFCEFLQEIRDPVIELGLSMGTMIYFSIPAEPCLIGADRALLELMLYNLLHNSLYYSDSDKEILVRLEKVRGGALLSVSDNGIGIPQKYQKSVWRPYVSYGLEGRATGVGLGLALVKAVVDAHSAGIDLLSEEGKGTCVTIRFLPAELSTPVALVQESPLRQGDRFSALYIGLSDALNSPYRQ